MGRSRSVIERCKSRIKPLKSYISIELVGSAVTPTLVKFIISVAISCSVNSETTSGSFSVSSVVTRRTFGISLLFTLKVENEWFTITNQLTSISLRSRIVSSYTSLHRACEVSRPSRLKDMWYKCRWIASSSSETK